MTTNRIELTINNMRLVATGKPGIIITWATVLIMIRAGEWLLRASVSAF